MSEPIPPELLERLKTLHEVRVPLTVGRATVAWNTLSGCIFDLFSMLSEMGTDAAKATFFTVASDRSQRDMVSNLVELRIGKLNPKLAKDAQTLLGEANKLAGKRNDILHVVFIDDLDPSKVSQLQERGHLRGKAGADLLDAIDTFAIASLDLCLKIQHLRGDLLDMPLYQNRMMAVELLRRNAQRKAAELANPREYGLLDFPATTPPSPLEDQQE
ncbi:MAG: hypothetical protein Q8L54_04955 [Devosia sp.]|nr:hypothetical protein [Devosia sp.]